jgi:hypothetical protein
MKRLIPIFTALLSTIATMGDALAQAPQQAEEPGVGGWRAHAMDRPHPAMVTPTDLTMGAAAPPNAVVLFDGRDLAQWTARNGAEARWRVQDGYMEVVPGTGDIQTRPGFGDIQLHVEWASPAQVRDAGQDRGNSGVMLMGARYEVQVLDSYQNVTYADGQAAAIYGQFPPRFNASRPPGEWQTYDIFFRRPRFAADGTLMEPARLTVLHNGVLVQNNEQLFGRTSWLRYLPYELHADELPIVLQDHGSPVRFRNIWAVRLPDLPRPEPERAAARPAVQLSAAELDRFVGNYNRPGGDSFVIARAGDQRLALNMAWRPGQLEMIPLSATEFQLVDTDGQIVFDVDRRGRPTGLTFHLGGARMPATRAR